MGLLVNPYPFKHQCYGTSSCINQRGTKDVGVKEVRYLATDKQVHDIIHLIRTGDKDLESKLYSMNPSLSFDSCTRIFEVLNHQKVDALGLCDWIRYSHPSCKNDVCSMVIDNIGRLGNYEAMSRVLGEFNTMGVSLVPLAFKFVSLSPSKEATMRKVMEILKKVGGPIRGSGLCSLIKMFTAMGSFEMAEFVMQLSERKTTFYNIMIAEMCRNADFDGAKNLVEVMVQHGFDPEAKTLNYIFSGLCKHGESDKATALFEQMLERKCAPDPITFEIFILHSCKVGNFDLARKLLDRMTVQGITPRLSTHTAILKHYFYLKRYKEAYQYVIESGVKYNCSHWVYSILARLYVEEDKVIVAHNLLTEMINKGLRPDHSVYRRVFRRLIDTGRSVLAEELRCGYSSVGSESTTLTG